MTGLLTKGVMLATLISPAATFAAFYEGFDYTPAGANIAGQSGGSGFTGNWTTPGTGGTVASPGLTYTGLSTAGNAWNDGDSSSRYSERPINTTGFGANNTSAWFSFLFRAPSAASNTLFTGIGTAGNYSTSGFGVRLTLNTGSNLLMAARIAGNHSADATPFGSTPYGSTHLVVGRIDFKAGNDDLRLWANPTLGSTPTDGSATVANLGAADAGSVPSILNIRGGGGTIIQVDEWRMGDSFAAVTVPEPAAALAAMPLLMLARRRRS
jgi:hypothetical protein